MEKINLERFICSLIEAFPDFKKSGRIPCMYKQALQDQGLEYKNGEIVKTQRRASAEAKEALFDYSNATIRQKDWAESTDQQIDPDATERREGWSEEEIKIKNLLFDFIALSERPSRSDVKDYVDDIIYVARTSIIHELIKARDARRSHNI